MKCPNCGKELSNDALTCPHCGADIEEEIDTILDGPEESFEGTVLDESEATIVDETTLAGIKKTWKSISGTEDIGQTIKESVDEVKAPSQISIREQNLAESVDMLLDPPPDYEIIEKIGEGGMALIYSARQSSVDRVVAIKMAKGAKDEKKKDLFLSEAVATGNLDHPNIVPIIDLGKNQEGDLFYSMKNVTGATWSKVIKKKRRSENLEILLRVCDALAFAHSKGVIHRDLKPENIMLGSYGEVYVMDWGLAASISEESKAQPLNEKTACAGTPAYMPPETAKGDVAMIGTGSDVYLLGALLFEIVTGTTPHKGASVYECLYNAMENRIPRTEKGGELLKIALRAMMTDPDKRFSSVKEFQAYIRSYMSHEESIRLTVEARKMLQNAGDNYQEYSSALFGFTEARKIWEGNRTAEKGILKARLMYARCALKHEDLDLAESLLQKDTPEHRRLINQVHVAKAERRARQKALRALTYGGIAAAALIILILTVAVLWIRGEQKKTVAEKERAEEAEQDAVDEKERAIAAEKQALEQKKKAEDAKALADKAKEKAIAAKKSEEKQRERAENAKSIAIAAQKAEAELRAKAEYDAYVGAISLAERKIKEGAYDQAEEVLDNCPRQFRHWEWGRLKYLCDQDLFTIKGHEGQITSIDLSPDNKFIFSGAWDSTTFLNDIKTGNKIYELRQHSKSHRWVFQVALSPDGKEIIVVGEGGNFAWDTNTGKHLYEIPGQRNTIKSIAYSPDGKYFLTGSIDNTARLWDAKTRDEVLTLKGHYGGITSVAFSPNGKYIGTGSSDKTAKLWNARTGREVFTCKNHQKPVVVSFSADNKYFLTASMTLKIWDIDTKSQIKELSCHDKGIETVTCSYDNKYILTGSKDRTIKIWEMDTWKLFSVLKGHSGTIRSILCSSDNQFVFSAGGDKIIKVWDVKKHDEVRTLSNNRMSSIRSVAYFPDGKHVVTGDSKGIISIFNGETGTELLNINGHSNAVRSIEVHPDGRKFLTGSLDKTAKLWDVITGEMVLQLNHSYEIRSVAISNDGGRLITAGVGIKVWDSNTGELIKTIKGTKGETGITYSVSLLPDDKRILTGNYSGNAFIWDIDYGKTTILFKGHKQEIKSVDYSPDCRYVVTGSWDQTVKIWDLNNGNLLFSLESHTDCVNAVAYSHDGRRILSCGRDGKLVLWDAKTGKEMLTIANLRDTIASIAFSPDGKSIVAGTAILEKGMAIIYPALDWTKSPEELEHEKLEAWRARWKKD